MKINPRKLMALSLTGFLSSLIVHFLTLTNLYLVSNYVILLLTIGILIVWLQSSENIKWIGGEDTEANPWTKTFNLCPEWLKYATIFLIVYGIMNFIVSADFKPQKGLFDFSVSRQKVRGISGIWMAFYSFGLVAAYARNKLEGAHSDE